MKTFKIKIKKIDNEVEITAKPIKVHNGLGVKMPFQLTI